MTARTKGPGRLYVSALESGQTCIRSPRGLVAVMESGNQLTRDTDAAYIVAACDAYAMGLQEVTAHRDALAEALRSASRVLDCSLSPFRCDSFYRRAGGHCPPDANCASCIARAALGMLCVG